MEGCTNYVSKYLLVEESSMLSMVLYRESYSYLAWKRVLQRANHTHPLCYSLTYLRRAYYVVERGYMQREQGVVFARPHWPYRYRASMGIWQANPLPIDAFRPWVLLWLIPNRRCPYLRSPTSITTT